MATKEYVKFKSIMIQQPIGEFYIGSIDSADLVTISHADIRRPEGRELERHIGTQRDLSEGRVSELKQYVTTIDACFPTSIILAISSEDATYNPKDNTLKIRKGKNVAKIIDGQHRIAGLKGYKGEVPFELNITIFVDMDIEDQAMVFATINLKQTKVTKSLAYDLYEYAASRSPQKTSHDIAKLVNFKKGSPFNKRIKILGKATGTGTETITQATFVDRLMKLISRDPMGDKDRLKRNRVIPDIPGSRGKSVIFRERFKKNKDAEIAKILWNYFLAVEKKWPKAWNNFNKGFVLSRTTGFASLIRLLPKIWLEIDDPSRIPSKEEFFRLLDKCTLKDSEFTSTKFKPGSTGEGDLLKRLEKDIFGTVENKIKGRTKKQK